MPRKVKSGLIQASLPRLDEAAPKHEILEAMTQKQIPLIEEAGRQGVQILCLQEIFNAPYFCPQPGRRLVRHRPNQCRGRPLTASATMPLNTKW